MLRDSIKATGVVQFVLKDENGNVKEVKTKNLVVDAGLAFIASRMKDTTKAAMTKMAVGTNGTAASDGQTALFAENFRADLDSTTIVTTTVANDTVQYIATFGPGNGTGGLQEAGIFNAASGGDMLCRTKFDVINKGASDTLTITWKVTVA